MIIIDFETRSECDLKKKGSWQYAEHPSTEVLCMGYGWSDGAAEYLWSPGDPLKTLFLDQLKDPNIKIAAQNAEFDWLIWNEVFAPAHGLPQLPIDRMYCTGALCRVNGLSDSLDKATRAAGVPHKKNPNGTRLITRMCTPPYEYDAILAGEMHQYCRDDIAATRALMDVLRPMTDQEHQDWVDCARLNDRGIFVDRHLAELAVGYAGAETEQIGGRLSDLTKGFITKHTQHVRVKQYMLPLLSHEQKKLTEVIKKGKTSYSFDGNVRQDLLACDDLAFAAREVLELVDSASKSSVAKYQKMLDLSDEEGWIRGAFVYFGASQTGRFSAKGLQLHNFPRDAFTYEEVEWLITAMEEQINLPSVMTILAKALRGAVVPIEDDHVFVVGDWSSIEAGALPWLTQSTAAEPKLEALRNGEDIYQEKFTGWHGDRREVHKVIELAFGYGGAVGAGKAMGRSYNVFMDDHRWKALCNAWRAKNQWAVDFWGAVEAAARRAVNNPGNAYPVGRVTYIATTCGVGEKTLLCILPDETVLTYPDVKYQTDKDGRTQLTAIKGAFQPAKGETEWPRVKLWSGLLVENITQAVCASLLRDRLGEIEADHDFVNGCTWGFGGAKVVGHIHDEIIVECPTENAQYIVSRLQTVMETCPHWATGLPLRAEPKIMWRYGK